MGVKAMAWAWDRRAGSPGAKAVLMALADHANDDGVCWPGQKVLAHKAEMTERAVRANIEKLVTIGLLRTEERRRADGQRSTNLYVLSLRAEDSAAGPPEAERTNHRKQASGQEPSVEPSEDPHRLPLEDRQRPRLIVNRKVVSKDEWLKVEPILTSFNERFGTTFKATHKEPVKMIVMRLREFAEVSLNRHLEIIEAVARDPWWGDEKPDTVGVIYSPKAFPRATQLSKPQPRRAFGSALGI